MEKQKLFFENHEMQEEMQKSNAEIQQMTEELSEMRKLNQSLQQSKEYSLLCLLTVNNGRVLTYSQIYEKVWGEALTINERGTIGYHVRNLRKKLYSADPHHPFIIESVREVGYRFQTTS